MTSMRRNLNDRSVQNVSGETLGPSLPVALVESHLRDADPRLFLNAIVLVATGNLVLNILRPDPLLIWQVRGQ